MQSYWFQRGVPGPETPAEFSWQGIDGTKIPAFWLPIGYGGLYDTPKNIGDFERLIRSSFEEMTPFARGYRRVLMAGADVSHPEAPLPILFYQLNPSPSPPLTVRVALPSPLDTLIPHH